MVRYQKAEFIVSRFMAIGAAILLAGCSSAKFRGEIRGTDYVSFDNRVAIALPRPYTTEAFGTYSILEDVAKDGAYYLMFGPSALDFEQYIQALKIIPKSTPISAYRMAGKGEPGEADIQAMTLGVERRSLEQTFKAKSDLFSEETISLPGHEVHYTVLVQGNVTRIPGLISSGPVNVYHGVYIYSTKKHTVLFRSTAVGEDASLREKFKKRSFGRMQAMFDSIKLVSVE